MYIITQCTVVGVRIRRWTRRVKLASSNPTKLGHRNSRRSRSGIDCTRMYMYNKWCTVLSTFLYSTQM